MPVQNKVSDKATGNNEEAKGEDFQFKDVESTLTFTCEEKGYTCCFCQKSQSRLMWHLVSSLKSECRGKVSDTDGLANSFKLFRNKKKENTFKEKHPEEAAAQDRRKQKAFKEKHPDEAAAQNRRKQNTFRSTR